MSFKTTIALIALVAAGAVAWVLASILEPREAESTPVQTLRDDLLKVKLTKIEISKGGATKVVLVKPAGQQDWTLPGAWPVRAREVDRFVDLVTTLRTRFAPQMLAAGDERKYGLDQPFTVVVSASDKTHTLTFGEVAADNSRFASPTWLRVNDAKEVLRLAPGLIAQLDRTQEYFQQRRLFAVERVPGLENPFDKIEQLAAKSVQVDGKEGAFTLVKKAEGWELVKPYRDAVDPDKLKSLLAALPDLWVERFVEVKDKKAADFGLEKPEYTFTIERPDGGTVKVLVGKQSDLRMKKVTKQGPPPPFPGMPPKTITDLVPEELRYARLEANPQVFEIKADRLKDIAVPLDTLRDPQVARFKTDDVRRLEIQQGGQSLVLTKDKDKWRLEKPASLDAETGQVTELLDKLADLKAKDKDVLDNPDLKKVGLDTPLAVIKIDLEETKGKADAKTTVKRSLTFQLGQDAKDKTKLHVRILGWPRVNVVEDNLLKLVDRPALAYRSKRVLDVAASDLAKIEVTKGSDVYTLEQAAGAWRLTAPVSAEVDAGKVNPLAADLARLEVAEYVTDSPKAEDLDKIYGLAKPALQAKLTFTDAKKAPLTLVIGSPRKDKQEYFARLNDGPVFAVKKDMRETLERDSLTYRPLQLWQLAADNVVEMAIQKDGSEYRLQKLNKDWKIAGPFEATAVFFQADALADDLATLKAEKYITHAAKDLKPYGLDNPFLRVRLITKPGKDDKDPSKERVLLVGHTTEKDGKARYAKLGDSASVFVLNDKDLLALERTAYDYLDKTLLSVLPPDIKKLRSTVGAPFTLEQKNKEWQVTDSPAPTFKVEEDAVQKALRPWSGLRAEKIVAYGPKIEWGKYGLDKPATIAVTVASDDKDKKTREHVLALGGKVGTTGERYARLDNQEAVAVLSPATVRELTLTHLDFLNHQVLKFPFDAVVALERKMPGADLELVKKDEQWKLGSKSVDEATVSDLIEKAFHLRARRIAAYPVKDLKEFGLDKPAAVWTIRLNNAAGKSSQHVLKVGSPALDADKKDVGERFALVDDGQAVIVLGADLAKHLVASALHYADRSLASFAFADKATVEHKGRKATFERVDGVWQMTAPIKTEAEDGELDELIKDVKRLRADEFVAEKTDLAKFGLDAPQVQWKLFSGDKEVLNVAVGRAEAAKDKEPRHYARLGTSDLVFLLSGKTAGRLLDEYRRKKPWPSLDAAQVEKLVYQSATPFTLTKKDGDWQLAGKAEAKVNSKAVTDTLDGLARLKAQRFVVDAKADPKLYGLDPPTLTIEAHAASLKRTLLIGRTEGDSQRYYATTPGNDAVFLLSEEDARRIIRPLAGFLEDTNPKEKGK